MKLTKSDREAFVAAVMDDVPKVDYDAQAEKLATALLLERLPETIKQAYGDPNLRPCIVHSYISLPSGLQNFYGPAPFPVGFYDNEALTALGEKAIEQSRADSKLRENLASVIASCSTLKQAKERLPEFEKYLPAERDASGLSNLPAVSNVVAQLTKAGWPKGQERAAA